MSTEYVEYEADDLAPVGTCLQGQVTATFDQIVERFGKPNILGEGLGSGDKVWWEWGVQFTKWDDALEDDEPIYAPTTCMQNLQLKFGMHHYYSN